MTVMSGALGVVGLSASTALSTVRNWTLNQQIADLTYAASNTKAGTARLDGLLTWGGSFLVNGGTPPLMPRELFNFYGFTGSTTGVIGTTGPLYQGQARCDSVAITWDWATGAIVASTINFTGINAVTQTNAASAIVDNTDPITPQTCAARIQMTTNVADFAAPDFDSDGITGLLNDVTTATLTITAANVVSANSGTTALNVAGVIIPAWKPSTAYTTGDRVWAIDPVDGLKHVYTTSAPGHTSGATFDASEEANFTDDGTAASLSARTYCTQDVKPGRIDWTLAVGRERAEIQEQLGANRVFRIWVDETSHWTLEWGKILQHSGLTVDPESDSIVAYTKNVAMQSIWTGSGRSTPNVDVPGQGGSGGGTPTAITPPSLGRIWRPGDAEGDPWFPMNI